MEKALEIIKKYENFRAEAYRCPAGVWTIGWGHTRDVHPGDVITREQADMLLHDDVEALYVRLDDLARRSRLWLTANQRAALVSFAYNVGFRALRRSTLWQKIQQDPYHPDICREFARWRFAGGREMPGLVKRRAEEAALYMA